MLPAITAIVAGTLNGTLDHDLNGLDLTIL
jgi:hypothetical protein